MDVTVDDGSSMPVTTKAQPGAEHVESESGVKHQRDRIYNKMQNSEKTLEKC